MFVIFPPRPIGLGASSQLSVLEKRKKYIAQRKFRGSRNLIHRSTSGEITMFSRHGRRHLTYKISKPLQKELSNLNFEENKEYWLDSELMHPRISHVVILYDVLHAGRYLYGHKQSDRLELLNSLCRNPQELAEPSIALRVSSHVWLAQNWESGFVELFREAIDRPEYADLIEGLVLREKSSILDNYGRQEYEVPWQMRVRKPGPNYQL